MFVDVRGFHDLTWDENLRPVGESTFEKETFEDWWHRNGKALAHLHPIIAEQWIYRHWTHSPYCSLPLARLDWRRETWLTERLLDELGKPHREHWQPEWDYGVFHGNDSEPGTTMDATGTWDYPVVILETPHGALTIFGEEPDVRFWLIEGHQRLRYLNTLHHRGECASQHDVFVLTLLDDGCAA